MPPPVLSFSFVASESHERQTSIAAAEAATRQPSDIPSKLSSAPQLELHEDRLPRLESCGEGSDAQSKLAL